MTNPKTGPSITVRAEPTTEIEADDEGPGACVLVFNANDPSGAGGIAADITAIASVGAHALPIITGSYARDTAEVYDHFSMAEELWSMLGQTTELTFAPFPVADPALLVSDTIEIPIQVNGKVRSKLSVVPTVTDDELRALALADEKVIALLNGAEPAKVVIVPKRLVNVVL
jgi:hypothetical protein